MSSSPLTTSVIVPTYNRSTLLAVCLDSILSQTQLPTEILVIDDGSTDDTESVVEKVAQRHPVKTKIRRHPQEHRGVSTARNTGLNLAAGDVVLFLDSDDTWEPGYVQAVTDTFVKHPEVGVVLSWCRTIDECNALQPDTAASHDAKMRAYRFLASHHEGDLYLCDAVRVLEAVIRQLVIVRVQGLAFCPDRLRQYPFFEAALSFTEDSDYAVRLIAAVNTVGYLDQPLVKYILHGANTVAPASSGQTNDEKIRYIEDMIAVDCRLLPFCTTTQVRREVLERIAARFRLLGWLADDEPNLSMAEDRFMAAYLFGHRKRDVLRLLGRRLRRRFSRT